MKLDWSERKEWLLKLREPFLSFLRNLAPQILVGSLTWVLASKLDFTKFDMDNFALPLAFWMLLVAFLAAVYANSSLFYEQAFSELVAWRKRTKQQFETQGKKGGAFVIARLRSIWRERFLEHVCAIVLIIFFQIAFAVVLGASIVATANFLHIGGK